MKNKDVVAALYAAYRKGEWDRYSEYLTPSCRWTDGSGTVHVGPSAVAEYMRNWAQFSSDQEVVDLLYVDGECAAAVEREMSGTNDGPIGAIAPTGKQYRPRYCEVYVFDDDGRIREYRGYANNVLLMEQLGLLGAR